MAQEVRFLLWCDVCLAEEVQELGSTVQVQLGNAKPMQLELCERHEKALVQPLRDALASLGSRADQQKRQPQKGTQAPQRASQDETQLRCFWCPMVVTSRSGLAGHLKRHGMPGNFSEAYGPGCPWCGEQEIASLGRSFSWHIRKAHPDSPTARGEAWQAALDAGDPAGLVAKMIAHPPGKRRRR